MTARAPILRQEQVAPGCWLLDFRCPEIAVSALPGQFVMVRTADGFDPLLRRPFSLHMVRGETISILYRVVGRGTELLSHKGPGDAVDVVGPLGQGFSLDRDSGTVVMVAGGLGIAPLAYLAQRTRERFPSRRMMLFYGTRTQEEMVPLDVFQAAGVEVNPATEDGSRGERGFITDVVSARLSSLEDAVFRVCGPHPMVKALDSVLSDRRQVVEVSLEALMACGLGACLGCAVATRGGYRHVCQDGPVFRLEELF